MSDEPKKEAAPAAPPVAPPPAPAPTPAPAPAPSPAPAPEKESKWQKLLQVAEEVIQVAEPLLVDILQARSAKSAEQLTPLAKKLQALKDAHAAAK